MIQRAYEAAVELLRRDPHFPLLVPTLLEVAAQYRRLVPGAGLDEVRALVVAEGLKVADWGAIAETTSGRRVMVA